MAGVFLAGWALASVGSVVYCGVQETLSRCVSALSPCIPYIVRFPTPSNPDMPEDGNPHLSPRVGGPFSATMTSGSSSLYVFVPHGVISLMFFGCYFSSSNYRPGKKLNKSPEDIVSRFHYPHGLLVPS